MLHVDEHGADNGLDDVSQKFSRMIFPMLVQQSLDIDVSEDIHCLTSKARNSLGIVLDMYRELQVDHAKPSEGRIGDDSHFPTGELPWIRVWELFVHSLNDDHIENSYEGHVRGDDAR